MREYVRRSEYHPDMEKLRELLSKVAVEQKLNILKWSWKSTILHTSFGFLGIPSNEEGDRVLDNAAYRDDAEMITTILSSLQFADRIKLLLMKNCRECTPLHAAVSEGHSESVKAILNSLSSGQQMQLFTEEGFHVETVIAMASGRVTRRPQ